MPESVEQGWKGYGLAKAPSLSMAPSALVNQAVAEDPPMAGFYAEARNQAFKALGQAVQLIPGSEYRPGPGAPSTASQETLQSYIANNDRLMRKYARESRVFASGDDFPYVNFANWILSLRFELAEKTYTIYRQSVIYTLSRLPGDAPSEAIGILLNNDIDDEDEFGMAAGRRKSPTRVRRFLIDDYERLIGYLRFKANSENAARLADILDATVVTGLRPIEWRATDLRLIEDPSAPHGRQAWLFVVNAKTTNGRGNGQVRSLDLSDLSDIEMEPIRRTSEVGRLFLQTGEYETMMIERMQVTMRKVICKLFGKHPIHAYSMYTARHQAIANWKSIYTAPEVAALSGHAVPRTAATHYGRTRDAWARDHFKVAAKPNPDEVEQVRARVSLHEDRKARLDRITGDDIQRPSFA